MKRKEENGLYIALISIHGLIRENDLELGRDPDTGGQTRYVRDLAYALGQHKDVDRVDLVTQRIEDEAVSEDYAQAVEPLNEHAQIVRINIGTEGYTRKEELWEYLDIFADNLLAFFQEQERFPNILHSHYADAGFVGARLANLTGIPLVHTGHSLGRDKRLRLLAAGMQKEEIESRYNISRRIEAEEEVLATAELVVTSTRNEIEDQYEHYDFYHPDRMVVIPPGADLNQFYPPTSKRKSPFLKAVRPFLRKERKPIILALSRPDERKNIKTLIHAYGQSARLRKMANLVIIAGNRDDIRDMDEGSQQVIQELLLLIDFYDLYGKVALPKHHKAEEVPEIYRMCAASGGVFINPALTEPFGLTLLEAAATGCPLLATENGGPVDIIENCQNGLLFDPLDAKQLVRHLVQILSERSFWQALQRNGLEGVRKHYSWQAHVKKYLKRITPLVKVKPVLDRREEPYQKKIRPATKAVFSDLDQNLIGSSAGRKELIQLIRNNRKKMLFGIATGRTRDSALATMVQKKIPRPDVLITGLGTSIYYGRNLLPDLTWRHHLDYLWTPVTLKRILADTPGLRLQPRERQGEFKLSYFYDEEKAPSIEELNVHLRQHDLTVNLSLAFGQYLDIVPVRASKGLALRYVAHRLEIPLENILVAGGSGADEDMMRGNTRAVVVGNRHHEELSDIDELDGVYFAKGSYAHGVVEGIEHYDFLAEDEEQSSEESA
ncbi:MAG: HAD family hydrolase [Candidatus Electrothrix sp. GW3-4]|uniref:HAD family hydrolase n=1 Tax=Candidatus Electrothrix sp. GW3-4 TaxID=3126740 RepID=UPI0030D10A0C